MAGIWPSSLSPALVSTLSGESTQVRKTSESSSADFSAEKSAELDTDVFLTWVDSPDSVDTSAGDKLLGQIPAIADGHWYAETDKTTAMASTNPTPLSIPVIVSDFLPHVVEAIEG